MKNTMLMLADPRTLRLGPIARPPALSSALPMMPEPDRVASIPVLECGDRLVTVTDQIEYCPAYVELGIPGALPELRLRSRLLARLVAARRALPPGYDLLVLDGWRSAEFQAGLLKFYREKYDSALTGYVSDPSNTDLIAPHTTGGAVDLTLTHHGIPLALGTDFDDFSERAHPAALEQDPDARLCADLRRVLGHALVSNGLAPYPYEWWHWSYGDQRWAAQFGQPAALYRAID